MWTDVERDAERWRALINSGRVRVLGSARLGKDSRDQHIGLELWESYPWHKLNTEAHQKSQEALTLYVDTIIRNSCNDFLESMGIPE
jgi:hypothetical protein